MDGVIQRGEERNWSNLEDLREEYNIFSEEEAKDREDATVNGVDLSNSLSLFRSVWSLLWFIEAIEKETTANGRSELLTRLLRNLHTIPQEEDRGNQMWELVVQITDFSLKATASMFKSTFGETVTVFFVLVA